MRNLFLIVLLSLVAFSQAIQFSKRKIVSGGVPVISWLGGPNPDRAFQIDLFHTWLSNHGYPAMEVKVDTQNQGLQKIIIQGVAGVAGDVPELYSGQLPFIAQMGILEPVDDIAEKFGFAASNFLPAIGADLFVDGVRYAYPCNMSILMLLANIDTFRKAGMAPPPYRWSFDHFEELGKEFCRRANANAKGRRLYYFSDNVPLIYLRRSVGVSQFNETLTGPALNDPRYAAVLRMYHRWIYDEHIIPSAAEISAFDVEAGGFSGYSMQLFAKGNFAMIFSGRHAVVQFRAQGFQGNVSAVEPPHGGYPNTGIGSRMVTLFKGSPNRELAGYFLAFFTSRELNMHLVKEGDAFPPMPGYTELEEFLRPAGHENEWPLHQAFSRAVKENPIPFEYSPFLQKTGAYIPLESKYTSAYLSGAVSPEEALGRIDAEVAREIKRYLEGHPDLQSRYRDALERQKKIDAVKKIGGKIPLSLVDNPFLKKYYRDNGRGE